MDQIIWHLLLRWAKRRHHQKAVRWVIRRYFQKVGRTQLVFAMEKRRGRKKEKLFIFRAFGVKIQCHTKVKSEAHPFDPAWSSYFEARKSTKLIADWSVLAPRYLDLWKDQKGLCPICSRFIEADDLAIVDAHHQVPRARGGSDDRANLVLLHLNCHKQHHSTTDIVRAAGAKRRAAAHEALRQYEALFPVPAPQGA